MRKTFFALLALAFGAAAAYAAPFAGQGPSQCSWGSGAGCLVGSTTVKVSVSIYQESTSSAYTAMSAFDYPVNPSEIILAECSFVSAAAAATTGIQIQTTGPASPTFVRINRVYPAAATITYLSSDRSAFDSGSTDDGVLASQGTSPTPTTFQIFLVNGANAGTIKFALESEVNASNVAVYEGSYCIYRKM